jgi:DNA-binding transcriptional LysR family regulator
MFEKLFAESGLSLDRLRAMLEVGASGSIVKAANGDPVRQSQYSRQIKELEEFFRVKLFERHEKGMQLTSNGKELARISRFFLLGLSNFQRGCRAEVQTFRLAASSTILERILAPVLSTIPKAMSYRFTLEPAADDESERRLHDLTLDFAIVSRSALSRPLQVQEIGKAKLLCLVPRRLQPTRAAAIKAFNNKGLPLAVAVRELDGRITDGIEPNLTCDSFLTAVIALESQHFGTILPDFLAANLSINRYWQFPIPKGSPAKMGFHFAWNPRLLRLNPHVVRTRDLLIAALRERFSDL